MKQVQNFDDKTATSIEPLIVFNLFNLENGYVSEAEVNPKSRHNFIEVNQNVTVHIHSASALISCFELKKRFI